MSLDEYARQQIAELQAKLDVLEGNTLRVVEGLEKRTDKLVMAQAASNATLELMRLCITELVAREKSRPGGDKKEEATA